MTRGGQPWPPLTAAEKASLANVQRLTTKAAADLKAEKERIAKHDAAIQRTAAENEVWAAIGAPYPPDIADDFRAHASHHMRVKATVYSKGAAEIAAATTADPDEVLDMARGVERAASSVEPRRLVTDTSDALLPANWRAQQLSEEVVLGGVMHYPETLRALRRLDLDQDFTSHGHVAKAITSLADNKKPFGPDAVVEQMKTMNVPQPVPRPQDGKTYLHDWADGAGLPIHTLRAAEDLRTIRIARETEDVGKWLQAASRAAVDGTGVLVTDRLDDVQAELRERLSSLPQRIDLTSWDLLNHPKSEPQGLDLPETPEWMRNRQAAPISARHRSTQARR